MAKTLTTASTFAEYDAWMGDRDRKKVTHNTYAERLDADTVGIRLYATVIIELHRDGTIVLDSGGWRTVTTKERMTMRIETTTRELFTLGELDDTARERALETVAQWQYEWATVDELADVIAYGIAEAIHYPTWDACGPGDFPGIAGLELYEWDVERRQISVRGSLTRETAPALPWAMFAEFQFAGREHGAYAVWMDEDGETWDVYPRSSETYPDGVTDAYDVLAQAISEALHDGIIAAVRDLEYRCSDEYVAEWCEMNGTEFLADGRPA